MMETSEPPARTQAVGPLHLRREEASPRNTDPPTEEGDMQLRVVALGAIAARLRYSPSHVSAPAVRYAYQPRIQG